MRIVKDKNQNDVEPRFSRGTLSAIREADRLERDLQSGVVTRDELVRTGRAFVSVEDWLKAMV